INVPANSQVQVQFDITLAASLASGTVVLNQSDLFRDAPPPPVKIAESDDPNINGQSDPNVAGDGGPARAGITAPQPPALQKANPQRTAAVGDTFRYRVTVPSTPFPYPLYDVRITDDLGASAANLAFVSVAKIAGSGAWTPT